MRRRFILVAMVVLAGVCAWTWWLCLRMPGESYSGPLPPLTDTQEALRQQLEKDVRRLTDLGPRHVGRPAALSAAADWIDGSLSAAGYTPTRQTYGVTGVPCSNIIAEVLGSSAPEEVIVIGAHYDTEPFTPGADDNASGVAAMLALARRFVRARPERTLRFIAFVNEEMPHFYTPDMGSYRAAEESRVLGENIALMLSLESVGYYSVEPGSQRYPFPLNVFYPDTGDFIGFVSNLSSRALLHQAVRSFRATTPMPSEGAALPEKLPGVGWSDHWAYWKRGYPALMVTDTAPFRNPHYHRPTDQPKTLDYRRMALLVTGLEAAVTELSRTH